MISSAPSILPAPLPSRCRLGLRLLCQETRQQNLKPPQLLPPLSLSLFSLPMISDFGKEAEPGLVSRVKLGHFFPLVLSGFFLEGGGWRWLVFCSPPRLLATLPPLSSSPPVLCVCVHSEGLAGISLPPPLCSSERSRFPSSHHHVGDKRSGRR